MHAFEWLCCFGAEFEQHLASAEIVVTTPFHPAQVTRDRLKKAEKLKLVLTAGIGSDHIDLHAAADNNLTVAEVQGGARKLATLAWRGQCFPFWEGATKAAYYIIRWRRRTRHCSYNIFEAVLNFTALQD